MLRGCRLTAVILPSPQVLKDDTTLEDNKVSENGFMVVMVTKVCMLRTRAACKLISMSIPEELCYLHLMSAASLKGLCVAHLTCSSD